MFTSVSLTMPKSLTVWIIINYGKHLRRWGLLDHLTCFLRNLYVGQEAIVRNIYGTIDCSKLRKEYDKTIYCHPVYLTYMQGTSCEMPGWMSYKLELSTRRNINNFRYADDTTLMTESKEKLKSLLMRVKEESEKTCLKLNIKNTKINIHSHHFMTN